MEERRCQELMSWAVVEQEVEMESTFRFAHMSPDHHPHQPLIRACGRALRQFVLEIPEACACTLEQQGPVVTCGA